MAVVLTPGQAGDNPQLLPLLQEISVARTGPGRPRQRPDRVVADKAYSHPSTRTALRSRGIAFTCPEKSDQIARRKAKGSAGGRPPAFDQDIYAGRNVVETSKPQCCHSRGWSSSLGAPFRSGLSRAA